MVHIYAYMVDVVFCRPMSIYGASAEGIFRENKPFLKLISKSRFFLKMDTEEICILVANDDLTCNNVVSQMLLLCSYQVLHVGSMLDVLNAIWEVKNKLDLVLTNAHKLESNGMLIVRHVQKKLNIPVVLMCADETTKISSKDQPFGFAAYILNGLTRIDVNSLWQFALGKEKGNGSVENIRKSPSVCSNVGVERNGCSPAGKTRWFDERRTRKESAKSKVVGGREDPSVVAKKPRVVWTKEMHEKFLEAIEMIGYEKAVPKKIVEVMGISGLSRENVASHLQKFRGITKRTQEIEQYMNAAKSYNYLYTRNEIRSTFSETRKSVSPIKNVNFVGYRLARNGNSIEFGNGEDTNKERGCSSVLDDRQDVSTLLSTTETAGNSFPVQNSEEFSQMAQSFDDFLDGAMMNGEDQSCQLNWEEFCGALFEQDD